MDNCIVTRTFRGAALYLAALHTGNGYQWTTDRATALRLPAGAALDAARAASEFDPRELPAVALDPLGQVLKPSVAHLITPQPFKYRGYTVTPNGDEWGFRKRRADVWEHAFTADEARARIDALEG